jgi:hypothetical protein
MTSTFHRNNYASQQLTYTVVFYGYIITLHYFLDNSKTNETLTKAYIFFSPKEVLFIKVNSQSQTSYLPKSNKQYAQFLEGKSNILINLKKMLKKSKKMFAYYIWYMCILFKDIWNICLHTKTCCLISWVSLLPCSVMHFHPSKEYWTSVMVNSANSCLKLTAFLQYIHWNNLYYRHSSSWLLFAHQKGH